MIRPSSSTLVGPIPGRLIRAAVGAIAFLLAVVGPVNGQSWRLDGARQAALDRVLRSAAAAGDVPGVVVLVTSRDSVLYQRAFGMLDSAAGSPMRIDALFEIASMTKPITSLGVMMLVEEGRLGLDDPASRHLPELVDRQVLVSVDSIARKVVTRPASRDITVRDLLRHTSGIGYPFSSHELLAVARHTGIPFRLRPLVHDPGARWTYGMGTAHLGSIIERLTGMSLLEFFERRIFGPLGMAETSYNVPPARIARLATTFNRRNGHLVADPRPDSIQRAGAGDGGLVSTAADYARFIQLVLGRGEWRGRRLVSEASIAEMTRDQLGHLKVVEQPGANPALSAAFPLGAGRDGFGLGFQIAVGGSDGRPDGTLSWAGIENTHFWIDRTNGIGVVFLTQVLPFYDPRVIALLRAVERALYQPGAAR